jgi:tight adherence protein B
VTPTALLLAAITALGAVAVTPVRSRRRARARLASPGVHPVRGSRRVSPPAVALAVAGTAMAWAAAGAHVVAVLAVVAAAGPLQAHVRHKIALRHQRDAQLPAALDRLAASLRSGASLPMALDEVGAALEAPIGPELTALAHEADRGRPVRDVLDDWSAAHDDPGTRLAATALVLATVIGSAPARAVDGVAATVRERLDLAAERRALASQARTSALVLSVAPVGFAALLVVGDTAAARFLLGTPAGWACLVGGITLDAAGAWWMARLSRSDSW